MSMNDIELGDIFVKDDGDLGLSMYLKHEMGSEPERICFLNQLSCFKLEEWLRGKNEKVVENTEVKAFRERGDQSVCYYHNRGTYHYDHDIFEEDPDHFEESSKNKINDWNISCRSIFLTPIPDIPHLKDGDECFHCHRPIKIIW